YMPLRYFVLSFSSAHPYLHPFPTRRSSDLFSARSTSQRSIIAMRRSLPVRWTRPRGRRRSVICSISRSSHRYCRSSSAIHSSFRSEEHTSELQSRENLVCRLLLEKKKHTTY